MNHVDGDVVGEDIGVNRSHQKGAQKKEEHGYLWRVKWREKQYRQREDCPCLRRELLMLQKPEQTLSTAGWKIEHGTVYANPFQPAVKWGTAVYGSRLDQLTESSRFLVQTRYHCSFYHVNQTMKYPQQLKIHLNSARVPSSSNFSSHELQKASTSSYSHRSHVNLGCTEWEVMPILNYRIRHRLKIWFT